MSAVARVCIPQAPAGWPSEVALAVSIISRSGFSQSDAFERSAGSAPQRLTPGCSVCSLWAEPGQPLSIWHAWGISLWAERACLWTDGQFTALWCLPHLPSCQTSLRLVTAACLPLRRSPHRRLWPQHTSEATASAGRTRCAALTCTCAGLWAVACSCLWRCYEHACLWWRRVWGACAAAKALLLLRAQAELHLPSRLPSQHLAPAVRRSGRPWA